MLAVRWAAANANARRVFTANLNVNYRRPLPSGSPIAVQAQIERIDRRKLYIEAVLVHAETNVVYSDATALYIVESEKRR
jgi:thioesterase superfamily protein 4